MKFSPAQLDELRLRFPVTKVAGDWVRLRQQRQRNFTHSGPCPIHSPNPNANDSTSFACNDEAWVCTTCGGGDVFDLVARKNNLDPKKEFVKAVELLGGVRELSDEERRALEARRDADHLASENERNEWRDRERQRAYDIYAQYSFKLRSPNAQAGRDYLREARGVDFPDNIWLRFNPKLRFYQQDKPKARLIHEGPALLLALQRDGQFVGVHMTWFDLSRPKGKALIIDPKTGDTPNTKKMRGTKAGAYGDLTRVADPETLILGEGIEKVLSVWTAMNAAGRDLSRTAFWTACDLGNLGGPHEGTAKHPTLKSAAGRAQGVPGPVPNFDKPAIEIPDSVTRLVLLGDSTSDRFSTECVIARAAARYARPGRDVVCAWSPDGQDFDDLLREVSNDQQ